jgi:integrase
MKHLTPEQIAILIVAPRKSRDRLLLTLCYEHGLRVSEALALTPGRLSGGYLRTDPLKSGNRSIQKLSFSTMQLISEVCANLHPKARIFQFSRQRASTIFHDAARACNLSLAPRQGIHTLRHSIAHHLLDNGAPLPIVQRKLGHKSLASTGQYLQPDDSDVDRWSAQTIKSA